jgi:PAS domain S-box-containing protein
LKIRDYREVEKYKGIFENATEGIFQSTLDGRFLKVNPAMARIFGYDSPDDMVKSITDISKQIHVNEVSRKKFLEKISAYGQVKGFEARNFRKDQSIIWTRTNARTVRDKNGDISYFEGFLTDITAEKDATLALRESEERYRSLVDRLPGAVFLSEPDDLEKSIYISQKIKDLLGYSQDEWLSTVLWKDCIHPDDRDFVFTENKHANETGDPFRREYRLLNKEGGYIWIREESSLIFDAQGMPLFWQGFFLDITDQKTAEETILRSEKQFTKIFRSNPVASTITTFDEGEYIDANQAYYDLSGYQADDLIGRSAVDLGFITKTKRKKFTKKLRSKKSIKGVEGRLVTKDGVVLNTLEFYETIRLRDKDHILATFHDITGRVTALRALQESEERYRSLVELSPEAILIHAEGKIIFANTAAMKLLGATSAKEFIGKSVLDVVHPDFRDYVNERVQRAIETGETLPLTEEKFLKLNGDVIDVEITSQPISYSGKKAMQVFARDITERKEDEETLGHQLEELTILHSVALAASSSTDEDDLIQRITDIIEDTLHPDNFGVKLVSESGDKILSHPSYRRYQQALEKQTLTLDKGVCGKVVRTGQSLRLVDIKQEPVYIEGTPDIQSELCVPIKIQDRVIGVLNVESKEPNAYNEADEHLLNTVAGTMATAIEQLRLFKTSQRRLQELTILNAVGQASTDATNVDELIDKVTRVIGDTIYPDNFGVLLLNKEGSHLTPHPSYRGITTGKFPNPLSLSQGVSGEVAATGLPKRVANVRTHKKYIEVTSQVQSELCIPIKHVDQILGVINAESVKINAFTKDDEQLLSTIANTLATAMEKLRLLEEERKRRQEAEALREATAALTTSIELESLYELILDSVTKFVPFDSASIGIFDQGYIKIVAGRNLKDNKIGSNTRYHFDSTQLENPESLRDPIIIPDVRNDDQFEKLEDTKYIRGWMGVPMVVQDQLIGFLNFNSSQPNFFTKEHASLAQTFGHQAAIVIENARLFHEENQRTQIIEAMAKITNEFATAHETMPALEKITKRSLELLRASTVAIYMLQDDNETIKVVTALGAHREQLISHTLKIGTGITGNIITTGKPEIVDDMSNDPRRKKVPGTPADDAQRDTIMSAPLVLRGKSIGAINAWRKRSSGLFNESELNFLVTIANQTSILIESIRLFQETARRAQEAHAIAEVGRDISSTLQLDIVLERIAKYAKELLMAETSAVYLSSPEDTLLRAIAAIGKDAKEIKNDPLTIGTGILGNIALQKSGEIVNDTVGDNRAIVVKGTEMHPNEHLMGVPVLSKDQLTGLLAVWRTGEGEEFKPFELDFLSSLAQQAAVAIENARLFEIEQRRLQEAETLRQTSEAITSTLDIQEVLTSTLENLNRVVPFDSAGVFLIEDDKVRLTAVKGMPDNEESIGRLFPADDTLLQEITRTRLPLILKDAENDARFKKWVTDKARGWLGIPLIARGVIIGYFTIDSQKVGAYSEHDANIAMTFAHQAAVAIENARLYARGESQIRQLTVLRDIDSAISSSFDLRVTLNLLIGYATKELKADAGAVLLFDSDLKSLSLFTEIGFTRKHNNTSSYIRIGEGLAGQVVLNRKLIHITDLDKSTEFTLGEYTNFESFKSYFGVPLIAKGQIKGVLELYTREESYPDPDWLNFLHMLAGQAAIAIDNVQMFKNLQRSNRELILAYDTTLAGWGRALELRDKETQGHTDRVGEMTIDLARRLGIKGDELTNIMRGTLLHDIGKMGIPDHILHKPGPLTEEEWEIMRQHPQYACNLIYPIPYLRPALDIPFAHHERWDGSGYPRGLKEEDIPLAARIFAVVDIWDALKNNRVYREAWPEEKVLEYLKNAAGIELDPDIVEIFLEMLQDEKYKNQAE